MKNFFTFACMIALYALASEMDYQDAVAAEYRNTQNPKDGWRVTPNKIQGTGENFRHGYQKGANGAWYGTGKDFGKIYTPTRGGK